MDLIQSFWSGRKEVLKYGYGWYNSYYHMLGWILSSNQLHKHHENLKLYTDKNGYEVLIHKLGLPYNSVTSNLNELDKYPHHLWVLSKIKVYALQDSPFLHVDSDVFIWEKFSEKLLGQNLIVQNIEQLTEYSHSIWHNLEKKLLFIPPDLNTDLQLSCNMGIVGGMDYKFINSFAARSFDFITKNRKVWSDLEYTSFCLYFEQVLFYQYCHRKEKKISTFFPNVINDNEYTGFGDFEKIPDELTYLHLLGDYKRDLRTCEMMENYVLLEYPMYLERLIKTIDKNFLNYDRVFPESYNFTIADNEEIYFRTKKKNISGGKLNFNLLERKLIMANSLKSFNSKVKNNNCLKTICNYRFKNQRNSTFLEYQYLDGKYYNFRIDEIDSIILDSLKFEIHYEELVNEILKLTRSSLRSELLKILKMKISYFLSIGICAFY